MENKLALLKQQINEIYDLHYVLALLDWDQQTNMPSGGVENRASQSATLSKIAHQRLTADSIGELLDDLSDYQAELPPDSADACLLKIIRRDYNKQVKVPAELVEEFARITALGQQAWEMAREKDEFLLFQPHLEQIVANRQQYAECFAPYDNIYDPLLDDYEPEMSAAAVKVLFDKLRPQQVELVKAISEAGQVDNAFMSRNYPEDKQWQLGLGIIKQFGYDFECGRQDKAMHPFTTTLGLGDVRITTRIAEDDFFSGLGSSMHEAGHAMYEQGIDRKFDRTPLGSGTSLGIHESQSRLWENMVGRSREFCQYLYPQAVKMFPEALVGIDNEAFYRGINRVAPSLIRVEADEASYNLHIMLRFEIELGLLNGEFAVADLSEVWNSKMADYLGVMPENDRVGVLQDVHWSCGLFGYFPTYAIGNLVAAQLWEKIVEDIPGLGNFISQGEFSELREWLRKNIHCHGAKFTPQELVRKVTGTQISSVPYMKYLNNKYCEVYGMGARG
ncbi:MAG: carboxypeptidase M32 [Victivallaceae bacterium]|nr:carboxypeptidase M32 [Victivallaceae bacterium]